MDYGGVQISPEHQPWVVAGFVFALLLILGFVIVIEDKI